MSFFKGRYIFESDSLETRYLSSDLRISSVTTLKQFKDFFRVPWAVYKGDTYWVPPFWVETRDFFMKKNLFWMHAETRLYVLYYNDQPVGRIAAFIDHKYREATGENVGFFGFFECIDDAKIASALFDASEQWFASKNITMMRGPINGRVDVGCGFLVDGFSSQPVLFSSYSPCYYLDFVEKYGMKKSRDQLNYSIDLTRQFPAEFIAVAKQCKEKGVVIRRFHHLRAEKEFSWLVPLYLQTFSEHWGYIPVSPKEGKSRIGLTYLRWIVDYRFFLVAMVNNEPVAFLWAAPDYNQVFKTFDGNLRLREIVRFLLKKRTITQGKLDIIGIKNIYRNKDIGSFLNFTALSEMKKRGYVKAECGWIDEQNISSRKNIEKTGATVSKRFRVYEKKIGPVVGLLQFK